MTCEQAELRMAELLAGECAAAERSELERHLLDCSGCREDFELARAGARVEWADVRVPAAAVEATLASFREPPALVRMFRWATAAAAVFGVAALLITSSRTAPPVPASAGMPERREGRRELLATMQDAVVGAMVCKDEDGRPVGELGLKSHAVTVEILDGIAKTTVEENFENHTGRRLEGTFNFPLPSDASISRLALEVNGKIEEGTCLERERAREVFEGIVRRMQDPALLEWQPGGFFKCRVFPIEPHATKRVIVAYTQALPCFRGKMSYVYPLASEKTRTHPPEEVTISVVARFSGGLSKIESTSHHLDVQRKNANEASMSFRAVNYRPNNDFVVALEPAEEEARVVSHKVDGEDGTFACFLTPRGGGIRRPAKYAFVVDASASISAPRLDVARRLVHAMMERRIDGDRFEVIAHNVGVERSGDVDARGADAFLGRLQPIGGSDVLQALLAAGDAEVIYIGKGSPTFGETDPSKILEAVKGRRIRTIAVGSDANVLLLEKLGGLMRVNPNDDVPKRVGEIAATLGSPVLAGLRLQGGDAVYDVVGVRDLFYGERIVLSGRYRGPASTLVITGEDYRREVEVAFPAKEEGNNYVRRLWAQRKVSDLLALGESKKPEVTDLGVKYQIMTPYTSFLVLETEQMWKDHQLKREVQKQDEVLGKQIEGKKKPLPADHSKGKSAEEYYRLAERSYTAGDFEKASREAQAALKLDPNHAPAKALYTENQFILGQGRATPSTQEYDGFLRQGLVRLEDAMQDRENSAKTATILGRYRRLSTADPTIDDFLSLGWNGVSESGKSVDGWRDEYVSVAGLQKFSPWKETETRAGRVSSMADFPGVDVPLVFDGDTGVDIINRANAAPPSQDLFAPTLKGPQTVREPELLLKEMEWQVVQLKTTPPPAVYTAKIEPGRTLQGRPLQDPDLEGLFKRWDLMQQVQSQLSRGADGKLLGTAQYDPQTNAFVVRDTPAAQARIAQVIESAEQSGGNVNGAPKKTLDSVQGQFKVVSETNGVVRLRATHSSVLAGKFLSIQRNAKFVALVRVERADKADCDAVVLPGLSAGRILPDDLAVVVDDPRAYLASLAAEVRADLASRANQQSMRAKMGLKE